MTAKAMELERNGAMAWAFHNPVRIVFGVGRLDDLARIEGVDRFLLVTTPGFTRRGVTARVESLVGKGKLVVHDTVEPNPDLDVVEATAAKLERSGVSAIIALGGGSAMDTAKALSVLLGERGGEFSLRAHLTRGIPLPAGDPLPLYAVPTTAGTGAEVTPFATVWERATEKKYSLTAPSLFPHTAILDPELTLGLPEQETVASGLDALSQGLESIWNHRANPITIALATRTVRLALSALPRLVREPNDVELRTQMMEASLLSGLAISVTRTALAHSMSYPLTARYGIPHGLACSFMLPALFEYNMVTDDGRLATLVEELSLKNWAELHRQLLELLLALGVPQRMREYLAEPADSLALVPQMFTPGRADNNLRAVEAADIADLLTSAFGGLGMLKLGERSTSDAENSTSTASKASQQ